MKRTVYCHPGIFATTPGEGQAVSPDTALSFAAREMVQHKNAKESAESLDSFILAAAIFIEQEGLFDPFLKSCRTQELGLNNELPPEIRFYIARDESGRHGPVLLAVVAKALKPDMLLLGAVSCPENGISLQDKEAFMALVKGRFEDIEVRKLAPPALESEVIPTLSHDLVKAANALVDRWLELRALRAMMRKAVTQMRSGLAALFNTSENRAKRMETRFDFMLDCLRRGLAAEGADIALAITFRNGETMIFKGFDDLNNQP